MNFDLKNHTKQLVSLKAAFSDQPEILPFFQATKLFAYQNDWYHWVDGQGNELLISEKTKKIRQVQNQKFYFCSDLYFGMPYQELRSKITKEIFVETENELLSFSLDQRNVFRLVSFTANQTRHRPPLFFGFSGAIKIFSMLYFETNIAPEKISSPTGKIQKISRQLTDFPAWLNSAVSK